MKKKILILAASFLLILTTSFAKSTESYVPENVSAEFNRSFSFASNVNWENVSGFYKVSFTIFNKTLFAFYTDDAEFMGIAINMPVDQLPAALQSKLKTDYSNYWVTDLFKVDGSVVTGYYITLSSADRKIMLRSAGSNEWTFYKTLANY
jgi:K+-transporting ATPase A subunit